MWSHIDTKIPTAYFRSTIGSNRFAVEVPAVEYKTLSSNAATEGSESIRQRVEKARDIQRERFAKERGIHTNAAMSPRLIRKHYELDTEAAGYLEHAMTGQNFSARAHDRILKVARTLADLEASERIQQNHVLEAINYRTLDRALWNQCHLREISRPLPRS